MGRKPGLAVSKSCAETATECGAVAVVEIILRGGKKNNFYPITPPTQVRQTLPRNYYKEYGTMYQK